MRLRQTWILGLGLSWLCAPAQATPFRDGPGRIEQDRGAQSLQSLQSITGRLYGALTRAPKETRKGEPWKDGAALDGAWQVPVGNLPPGLVDKGDFFPPGLVDKGDFFPPGLVDKGDFFPPGILDEGEPLGISVSDGGAPVPEPTGLVLFAAGLLLAGASERLLLAGASERQRRAVRRRL